ncbi:MAG: hypothetical protein VB071_14675 [Lawsonibacter sp.]|nr:hypothetical protein [Lawsonibacter sp.]
MKLPILKYTETAYRREVVPFLGLNQTDNWKDGELSVCKNLSARRYPCLSPRKGRSGQKYSIPSAIFAWDGKLVVVDGTTLLYDGEAVGTVTTGKKQFAVVNTKLCIWPDGVYLDLTNKEFKPMGVDVTAALNSVVFTADGITLQPASALGTSDRICSAFQYGKEHEAYFAKAYSEMVWDGQTEAWTLTGETEKRLADWGSVPWVAQGDCIPLLKTDVEGSYILNSKRIYTDNNGVTTEGSYGEVAPRYYAVVNSEAHVFSIVGGVYDCTTTINVTIYDGGNTNPLLTAFFNVGDRVRISGCVTLTANNTAKDIYLQVQSVTGDTITFKNGTLTAGSEAGEVVISRPLPPMDYICESENRIWGVSNADKTIYASALGDPRNFYVFDGVSTDSYAVAVGSEGDFTAICRYGNAVLCWKERTLHKIMGSYPAEYQMTSYQYAGIRAGCHKSLVNLNEVLYYLGVDGVYAYAGGTPTRISDALGEAARYQGVAGTDGRRYVLSCADGAGVWGLLVYYTSTRLWLREDETHAADFCRMGDSLLLLSGSSVYTMEAGTEAVEWSATLCPFFETAQGRKRFSRLFLRVEVPKGAWMMAEVRCDGGRWREAGKIVGGESDVRTLPIAPNRCDKFEVRLSGKGDCGVLSLMREFRVESER